MPFPIQEKYITETEKRLNLKFPQEYVNRMINLNGGEIILDKLEIELFPFFDKSNKKRIKRTCCNNMEHETNVAREWSGFPTNAIAIGADGFGNHIVLMHKENRTLLNDIYFWSHETGKMNKIANSINEFKDCN